MIMAISAAKQAFLDALAGVKQAIDTGDDNFSETELGLAVGAREHHAPDLRTERIAAHAR
jgi:hypothetical protein